MIPQAKFDRIRQQVLAARDARDAYLRGLERHYGPRGETWATGTERDRLTRLRAAYDRQAARMHKLLEGSPRDWKRGVPTCWVVEELTYNDAVCTADQPLSVVPPKAWGY